MARTCLFIINGLGLGNSTRCYAIMEHLAEAGLQIHALTSGNGLHFFQDKSIVSSLTQMDSFYYSGSNGAVSGWATLKSLKKLSAIARAKTRQLSALLDTIRPDVAIIDSEYALAPLKRRGIPIIAVNTSEMVVSNYLKASNRPSGIASQFWFVEFSDYLFHKYRCDLILCPSPIRNRTRASRFKRIGLVVRRSVLDVAQRTGNRSSNSGTNRSGTAPSHQIRTGSDTSYPAPRKLRTVLFMLSGSVHASNISFPSNLPFNVEVVGIQGKSSGNVMYHGRQMNNLPFLRSADALVINGGYSAVSEAFALAKPTFVVPVPGHAEQFVNAALVRDLGLGFVATRTNVVPQLLRMYERNEWIGKKPLSGGFELNGACEAASIIRTVVENTQVVIRNAGPEPATLPI